MKKNTEYVIPFSGLKKGIHEFRYQIDNTFFESFDYDEFNDADIGVVVTLNKTSTVIELACTGTGVVNVDCDLSGEAFNQAISAALNLVIKFGEEYNDDDDEILILPHGQNEVDIAQYLYEMLVLSVPQKRIHPSVLDGSMKSEILDRLEELAPGESKKDKDETDPIWDELKKLLTDKKS